MNSINGDFWKCQKKGFTSFDGSLNIAVEAVDRPCLDGLGDKTALIWLNHKGNERRFTFGELSELSGRFSAGLSRIGVKKGDRVFIYMERIPENYIAVLGVIKCGAIACPLFSGFGGSALFERINDSAGSFVITSAGLCGDIYGISSQLGSLKGIVVFNDAHGAVEPCSGVEVFDFNDIVSSSDAVFVENTSANDYALIHYTSGTTGKPKGAVHRHLAVIGHYYSTRETFKFEADSIYWCTADPGWITGTSHGIFGPWSLGVTQVVYAGGFDAGKWYETIDRLSVDIWYTSPTAIRQLMRESDTVKKYALKSLKRIYSVGEPLNPEAIEWSKNNLGIPVHDTWFQTETGAIMITNRPGIEIRPGSMGKPLEGITVKIVDDDGRELPPCEEGNLALIPDFPSLFVAYWKKDEIFSSRFRHGLYYTGDRARAAADGYFWFVSRNDDVMKVSGHLLGPFEVESALLEMKEVAESAVVGVPDDSTGEAPIAFVVLKKGFLPDRKLEMKMRTHVRMRIAPYAIPHKFRFVEKLPKTRSGKIVRRMLKNIEMGIETGDLSTLEE